MSNFLQFSERDLTKDKILCGTPFFLIHFLNQQTTLIKNGRWAQIQTNFILSCPISWQTNTQKKIYKRIASPVCLLAVTECNYI